DFFPLFASDFLLFPSSFVAFRSFFFVSFLAAGSRKSHAATASASGLVMARSGMRRGDLLCSLAAAEVKAVRAAGPDGVGGLPSCELNQSTSHDSWTLPDSRSRAGAGMT